MHQRLKWALGGLTALLIAGAALAQTIVTLNLSGNETILMQVGGVGGGSAATTVNALRNAQGYLLVATGTTVNTTVPNTASRVIATGAITTWNVTLPIVPIDGQVVEVACPGGSATVAITATAPSGVTIVGTAFTACTSGGVAANTAEFQYSKSANVWYRIQ